MTAMRSCLYTCEVMHHRLMPKQHRFSYRIFMFYIDLDEVEWLHKKYIFFSKNSFNWFSLRDRDHLPFNTQQGKSIKEKVINYLTSQGVPWQGGQIMLLTNCATFGYTFNPISIFLCFDTEQKPVCAVAEVNNTHGEMKLYMLSSEHLQDQTFRRRVSKYFYVSPFADLDSTFDFIFSIPNETINMRVDDYQHGTRFLLSSLKGRRSAFKDSNLLWYGLRFPFITMKIIALIYWQAFLLMIKGIPYQKKNLNPHMQRELYTTKKM